MVPLLFGCSSVTKEKKDVLGFPLFGIYEGENDVLAFPPSDAPPGAPIPPLRPSHPIEP
jgi:hypothetical protein